MSKDMLGSVVRASVSVPQGRMELLARIASDLAHDNLRGEEWFTHYDRLRAEGLPPPRFERNEHGHIIISITGLALTGKQEIERLEGAKFRISNFANSCLTSKKKDGYDECHRLEDGRAYTLALVPTKDVPGNRTTAKGRKYGESFGYKQPLAGVIPRIREVVSDEGMEAMGFRFITALHEPITDADGDLGLLNASRSSDGRWVGAGWIDHDDQWSGNAALAFLDSAR